MKDADIPELEPTGNPVVDDVRSLFREGVIQEYNHGFNDACQIAISSLNKSLEHAKTMDAAAAYLPGMELSIEIFQELQKNIQKDLNAQN